jgi:hypothetical protein
MVERCAERRPSASQHGRKRLPGLRNHGSRRSGHTPPACAYPGLLGAGLWRGAGALKAQTAQTLRLAPAPPVHHRPTPGTAHSAGIAGSAASQPQTHRQGEEQITSGSVVREAKMALCRSQCCAFGSNGGSTSCHRGDDLTHPCADGRWTADLLIRANGSAGPADSGLVAAGG